MTRGYEHTTRGIHVTPALLVATARARSLTEPAPVLGIADFLFQPFRLRGRLMDSKLN